MTTIREETTVAELKNRVREQTNEEGCPHRRLRRTEEAGKELSRLLERGTGEVSDFAALIGEIFINAMEMTILLKLDPAGCMTIAQSKRKAG